MGWQGNQRPPAVARATGGWRGKGWGGARSNALAKKPTLQSASEAAGSDHACNLHGIAEGLAQGGAHVIKERAVEGRHAADFRETRKRFGTATFFWDASA